MSNNRFYRYYTGNVLDFISTKVSMRRFSAAYKLLLQKKFNYNFSVFRSSNGMFVYGAAYTFFGVKPYKAISSRSARSKKIFPIELAALNSTRYYANTRKNFFKGLERFSTVVLASRGAYGFLDFSPRSDTPTHVGVHCKGVTVNPEMLGLTWKMRSTCSYSVWFKVKSENLLVSWNFLRCFQIPAVSVPFEHFEEEELD